MTSNNVLWPGWETVRLIGRGWFGSVYEIRREVFGFKEYAALKVISIPQNECDIEELYSEGYDKESITSIFQKCMCDFFLQMRKLSRGANNANIVSCDDMRYIQHDDGIGWDIFIKMELLTPLKKALPTEISEEIVLNLAADMCAALELSEKHNIVHHDIKPESIFVSSNGSYKLGDFGILNLFEQVPGNAKLGLRRFLAPELYNYQPHEATANIYSLGLVLYWLLNQRRMPFVPLPPERHSFARDSEALSRRLSGEPLPPPAHGSEWLKNIVLKACAYDPKERYQSARELREALAAKPVVRLLK